jgi:hypothetical protein
VQGPDYYGPPLMHSFIHSFIQHCILLRWHRVVWYAGTNVQEVQQRGRNKLPKGSSPLVWRLFCLLYLTFVNNLLSRFRDSMSNMSDMIFILQCIKRPTLEDAKFQTSFYHTTFRNPKLSHTFKPILKKNRSFRSKTKNESTQQPALGSHKPLSCL